MQSLKNFIFYIEKEYGMSVRNHLLDGKEKEVI